MSGTSHGPADHLEEVGAIASVDTGVRAVPAKASALFASAALRTALLVGALCYLGAHAGVWLTFPVVGASVVFLPYAVLLTALIVSPPHTWWLCVAASMLGNFLAHLGRGSSASFAVLVEAANVSRALVAAVGIRRFAPGTAKLNDLRSMSAFLVFGVGLGPSVGALVGGALVLHAGRSTDYWLVWEEWCLSNALTALTVCPVALEAIWNFRNREDRSSVTPGVPKRLETVLVAVALTAAAAGVFAFSQPDLNAVPARMYWPLPILLWIAVRFPPAGISSALLGVASLTIWGALHGRGPFVAASPTENLLHLQLFLIALALPLLLLASKVVEAERTAQERLLAEEERRQLEAERQVALTLQEADRRKDEFLAVLAHELRNPLAPVGLALELLRRQTPPGSDAARSQNVIARQLDHMTRLVDDLLDISRITQGTIELRLESIDLREVVRIGIETARPQLNAKRHDVVVNLSPASVPVRGDAMRLAQIVGNLVHNASRYTESGGRIEVSARKQGDQAVLCVRDNGVGIPADMVESIFDLFVQVRDRYTTMRGGLGIGLSLVKRLAELHGGKVFAESEGPGQGSTFTVSLPALSTVSLPLATAVVSGDDGEDVPLEILVVDDNIDAAEGLADLLQTWGHTTHLAHDGEAALEAARTLPVEVILLDLDLPKIDGYDVASALRRSPRRTPLVILALSGFGSKQHRDRALEVGFDHHFVKPVDIPKLRRLLRSAGRKHRDQREGKIV